MLLKSMLLEAQNYVLERLIFLITKSKILFFKSECKKMIDISNV